MSSDGEPRVEALLYDLADLVLVRLQKEVKAGKIPAFVYFDVEKPIIMSDTTYWADARIAKNFEERAARRAERLGAIRLAFAAPLVMAEDLDDRGELVRAPHPFLPVRDFETEILWVLALDLTSGFEVFRVDVVRENGSLSFGPLRIFAGEGRFLDPTPGLTIVKRLAGDDR